VDLSLTEPPELLRSAARSFVEREAPTHAIVAAHRGDSSLPADLWRKAVELGWPGILIPAEYGGSESSLTDAAVLFEELGRGPAPGPFFSSGVLGALTVREAATETHRGAILPRVASGEAPATSACCSWRRRRRACGRACCPDSCRGSLTEYGLVAHTQMSRTLFSYLGDPRWHKRRMADVLQW
jgi:hypothetical protein